MLFRDSIFAIEPLTGRVRPHSQITCTCSFSPKDALVYSCSAYLSCVGREERGHLMLKGLGIGPKAERIRGGGSKYARRTWGTCLGRHGGNRVVQSRRHEPNPPTQPCLVSTLFGRGIN